MADLVLSDVFGSSATYDGTNVTITFSLDDLDLDTSAIDDNNYDEYASRIFWSLVLKIIENQPATNNDETRAIFVTNQGKRTLTRNSVAQFSFGLLVSGHTPDSLGVELSPDDLVAPSTGTVF